MPDASYVRGNFQGGEWSKFAQGRYDLPTYPTALNVCLNALVTETGTWLRRPGTRYIATTFGGRLARLIAFAFKNAFPYMLEFTDSVVRMFAAVNVTSGIALVTTNDPQTVTAISAAAPAQVTTQNPHGWATGDHFFFAGMGTALTPVQNREFLGTVTGASTLTLQDQVTGENLDGSTLGGLPAGVTINRILKLGSPYATAQLPGIRKVQAETTAVFLHPAVAIYSVSVTTPPSAGTFATFSGLAPAALRDGPYLDQYIGTAITPTGTSGSITLQTSGAAFPGFAPADVGRLVRLFSQPAQWNPGATYGTGNIVALYQDPVSAPAVATYYTCIVASSTGHPPSLTPSDWSLVTGTNNAVWTWGTITAVNNTGNITVTINGPALLYNSTVIYAWRLGAYGGANGYPSCGVYHEGRLWLGGAIGNRFDASVSNDIFNMAPTAPDGTVGAANAITGVCNAEDVNPILWMKSHQQGVIAGTQAGEWLFFAPSAGAIAPNNIAAHRTTKNGGANMEAVTAEHTILFVQRYGRKIIEYFADVFSGKFAAPNASFTWKHLTKGGIDEIAYQQELIPLLWARVKGALKSCTYKRETLASAHPPDIAGGARHTLGSGRTVESIAVGPSVGGTTDSLMLVTNDPLTNVRYVEALSDILDEGAALTDAQYVDCAIAPSWVIAPAAAGMPYGGMTLNGLWAQNGKTVSAWIGGLDCGDYQVVKGAITVPFGDGISGGTATGLLTQSYVQGIPAIPIWVGFTYTSDGQIVRPNAQAETGARNGPGFGKLRRQAWMAAQVEGAVTNSISFGTRFDKLFPMRFKQDGGEPLTVLDQFTGVYRDNPSDDYSFDSMMCWRVTRPYPANVVAIGGMIQTQDA